MLKVNISDIAIIVIVKNVDYLCIIHNTSKSEAFTCFTLFCLVYIKWLILWKSLNVSIGTVKKNPEMLAFVPNYLKTKKKCKHAVKKLPYLLR